MNNGLYWGLISASYDGNLEIIKRLIKEGADVNARNVV